MSIDKILKEINRKCEEAKAIIDSYEPPRKKNQRRPYEHSKEYKIARKGSAFNG